MLVRDATEDDLPGIVAIYNDAVLTTTAVWNATPVDLAERRAWLRDRSAKGYPVLVAADEAGPVFGYGSLGDWRAWEGYRFTVEHSVYVHRDRREQGLGKALLGALIERAENLGKHVMVGGIEATNVASIALHERLGFEHAGRMKEVGRKFDRWLDLVFLQRFLDPPGSGR